MLEAPFDGCCCCCCSDCIELPKGPATNCCLDGVTFGGAAASAETKLALPLIRPGDAVRDELALSAPLLPLLPLVMGATGVAAAVGPFSVVGRRCTGRLVSGAVGAGPLLMGGGRNLFIALLLN